MRPWGGDFPLAPDLVAVTTTAAPPIVVRWVALLTHVRLVPFPRAPECHGFNDPERREAKPQIHYHSPIHLKWHVLCPRGKIPH